MSNRFFAAGAACLARSLNLCARLHRSTATICLIPEDLTDFHVVSALHQEGWEVVRVPRLLPKAERQLENPSYADCYMKLALWGMHDRFDRVLYIDADAIAVGDLSDLLYSSPGPKEGEWAAALDYDFRCARH